MTALPILSFDEAKTVGEALYDHWIKLTGEAPMPRGEPGWADLVQLVTRKACEQVIARARKSI
jgi:hypothetical protein